jgi:hypothetical protein
MKIAVNGTGSVLRALTGTLSDPSRVTVGACNVEATLARSEPDAIGNPAHSRRVPARPEVSAERIQATFPSAKVVKTFYTLAAAHLVKPTRLDKGEHSIFVSRNDPRAKKTLTIRLGSSGHPDVIDLGTALRRLCDVTRAAL